MWQWALAPPLTGQGNQGFDDGRMWEGNYQEPPMSKLILLIIAIIAVIGLIIWIRHLKNKITWLPPLSFLGLLLLTAGLQAETKHYAIEFPGMGIDQGISLLDKQGLRVVIAKADGTNQCEEHVVIKVYKADKDDFSNVNWRSIGEIHDYGGIILKCVIYPLPPPYR